MSLESQISPLAPRDSGFLRMSGANLVCGYLFGVEGANDSAKFLTRLYLSSRSK